MVRNHIKHATSVKDTYGGTNKIFSEFLPRINVDVALCDTTDHEAIEREVAKGCDLLYLESPTNPTVKVVDLARLAQAGRAAGALVIVDNTFATPINQTPLALGADLVPPLQNRRRGGCGSLGSADAALQSQAPSAPVRGDRLPRVPGHRLYGPHGHLRAVAYDG